MTLPDALHRGRLAFRAHTWAEAYRELSAAGRLAPLNGEDLEWLATSAFLAGHDDLSLDSWVRAHHGWCDAGNAPRAACGIIPRVICVVRDYA